jgi:predicted DNA-binding protein (MmcQ/YjbR family)
VRPTRFLNTAVKDLFQRPVFARVRRLCLAFPETIETASWGHPNFRAGKTIFCALEIVDGRPSIAFRLSPGDVELLLRRRQFFATPYGRGQWASLWMDAAVNWRMVERVLERSYRQVANQRMIRLLDGRQIEGGSRRTRPRTSG